ncbi:TIGR04282 family arsenosugar biosynthesis glycosyltransferase [Maribacter sp. 2210JD10-5]|uniref:TIGR04282 family arsenosugar biosynthesis glycosyltransferase n=1 Tax=Maribacter sp. 2210JD10-5 TaxID=3386272 RepID=UPI0039BD1BED
MSLAQNKTAILVFANSSKEELLHKPMQKGNLLFDALTQDTLKKVQRAGVPYFHISEEEQRGYNFGERFVHAITNVFDQGYDNVITIGNDTPQLTTKHLLETQRQLEEGKTVFGPSQDGGFYLMGLHRSNFDAEIFKRLPWQRFNLFGRISDILKNTDCSIFRLPTLRDIDDTKDIIVLSGFIKAISKRFLRLFALLINTQNQIILHIDSWFSFLSHSLYFNKGSPRPLYI